MGGALTGAGRTPATGPRSAGPAGPLGYLYPHHAVDDRSRLVRSGSLTDHREQAATASWTRGRDWFASAGIWVTVVMSDNGSCYSPADLAAAPGQVDHLRTRPYRPQTNGKVERFSRTQTTERASATTYTSDQDRTATCTTWLHHDNQHRPHTGVGAAVPDDRVHNFTGAAPRSRFT